MRTATPPMPLTDGQREILENLSRSRTAPHRQVQRARALLLAGQGLANTAIAVQVGVAPSTVQAWRDRFAEQGLVKFGEVATGRGRKPSISEDKIAEIVRATQETTPPGQTHWSCRAMAKAQGVSPATVQRIWSARGLKPHLVKDLQVVQRPEVRREAPTSSGSTSTRRRAPWCCAWMRSPRSRRWTAPSRPCLLYTSPSPRDGLLSRMPSSA